MTTQLTLNNSEMTTLQSLKSYAIEFAREHRLAIGLVEMSVGAGILALAVHNGVITLGQEVYASATGQVSTEALLGASTGAALAAIGSYLVGSIGVAAVGTAFAVPVSFLALGAALLLAGAGYALGVIIHDYLAKEVWNNFLNEGSIAVVGVALLLDGARRVIGSDSFKQGASYFANATLNLITVSSEFIIDINREQLAYLRDHPKALAAAAAGGTITYASGVLAVKGITAMSVLGGGVTSGMGVIAQSATIFGGKGLVLGVASTSVAPVLIPVIAGAALGVGGSYYLLRYLKRKRGKS